MSGEMEVNVELEGIEAQESEEKEESADLSGEMDVKVEVIELPESEEDEELERKPEKIVKLEKDEVAKVKESLEMDAKVGWRVPESEEEEELEC